MTTLTISRNNPRKMDTAVQRKSLTFKLVGILFILLVNYTGLSAKTTNSFCGNCRPIMASQIRVQKIPKNLKLYTILLVKNFPTIHAVSENLNAKEEVEVPSLDTQLYQTLSPSNDSPSKPSEISASKSRLTKIAPKLTS